MAETRGSTTVDGKLYVSKSVYCIPCDEGQRLHNAWLETLANHGASRDNPRSNPRS